MSDTSAVRLLRFVVLTAPFLLAAHDDATGQAVLEKYLAASRIEQGALRGVQMEVSLDAKLPRLAKHGKLHALYRISKMGKITYRALGFTGDNAVKNEVIARYMDAECKAHGDQSLAITPANYKFKFKGAEYRDSRDVYVFDLKPRRKISGLFRGELWLDPETGLPVRESGKFVKTPSIFLKTIVFVRDYEIRNGLAVTK
ncbi:MAG: hypothetical protein ACRD4A_06055, partial [Candidatus Acidiferrales bacterium]